MLSYHELIIAIIIIIMIILPVRQHRPLGPRHLERPRVHAGVPDDYAHARGLHPVPLHHDAPGTITITITVTITITITITVAIITTIIITYVWYYY